MTKNIKTRTTSKESRKVFAATLVVHNHKNVYLAIFMEEKTVQTCGSVNALNHKFKINGQIMVFLFINYYFKNKFRLFILSIFFVILLYRILFLFDFIIYVLLYYMYNKTYYILKIEISSNRKLY